MCKETRTGIGDESLQTGDGLPMVCLQFAPPPTTSPTINATIHSIGRSSILAHPGLPFWNIRGVTGLVKARRGFRTPSLRRARGMGIRGTSPGKTD